MYHAFPNRLLYGIVPINIILFYSILFLTVLYYIYLCIHPFLPTDNNTIVEQLRNGIYHSMYKSSAFSLSLLLSLAPSESVFLKIESTKDEATAPASNPIPILIAVV